MLTAKLKLTTTPEQFQALRHTQLAYRNGLNYVSQYAFEHGKMSNQRALQRECYDDLRLKFALPAQMACNVPRQVGAAYKALWTKVKHNAAARHAGRTKKRYKGLDQAPRYVSPTLTYNYQRDYSFKRNHRVSILTLQGRIIVPYTGYDQHVALIGHGAEIGAANLWYVKPHQQFYLLVRLEIEVADPTPEKRLVVISGRERRLKQDCNHLISRRIVDAHPHSMIGLENLTDIRERTTRQRGKKASKKQRRAHYHACTWAFAELHSYIAYKATLAGNMAVKVDAHHTSQACPMCGYASKANRPNKGLLFVCQSCHYTLHADLIGARNIALRTLLVRQDWTSTGVLSIRPDVSDDETKALRRQRYSELRWSPGTSPLSLDMG